MSISHEDEQTIRGLEHTLFSLHPNAEIIYKAIKAIKSNNEELVSGPKSDFLFTIRYDKKASAAWKILFAISHIGKFSKASTIKNYITHWEPSFKSGLSTPLTNLREEFKIVVYKPSGSNREAYYGFNKWIEKDGNPKSEYMYDSADIFIKE